MKKTALIWTSEFIKLKRNPYRIIHCYRINLYLEKKNLEECREEILKLTSQLDDKKREIYILETQVNFLFLVEVDEYILDWITEDRKISIWIRMGKVFSNLYINFIFSWKETKQVSGNLVFQLDRGWQALANNEPISNIFL